MESKAVFCVFLWLTWEKHDKFIASQGCRAVHKDWEPEGANRATRIQTWPGGRNLAILLGF